jgi:hypothetical protein
MVRENRRLALSTDKNDLCDTNSNEVFEELIQSRVGVAPTVILVETSVFDDVRRGPRSLVDVAEGVCTYTTRIGPSLAFFFTPKSTLIKCRPRKLLPVPGGP